MAYKILTLLLLCITYAQSVDDCVVTYTEQPPREFSCNPYATHLDPPQIFTRYACRAESTIPLDDFKITWFRESLDGTIQELECTVLHINTPQLQRCLLDITGETDPATYWCQASYTIDGNPQVLARSNEGIIEQATMYSDLPRCDGTNSEFVTTCADLSVITETTVSTAITTTTTGTTTLVKASQSREDTLSISLSKAIPLNVVTSVEPKQTNPPTEKTSLTTTYVVSTEASRATDTPNRITSTRPTQTDIVGIARSTADTTATTTTTTTIKDTKATTTTTVKDTEATLSTSTTILASSSVAVDSIDDNLLSNGLVMISLIVVSLVLLVALVIMVSVLITVVIVYRRRIRRFRKNAEKQGNKAMLRVENLESSLASQTHAKYVYPTMTGIYNVPSTEESRVSSRDNTEDSGRGSHESYQSLLCTNMEYTNIYTIPHVQNLKTRTVTET